MGAADFSGYATRAGIKCSDGRTIMAGAFKHNDKLKVPLVWQHMHNDPGNVLGHALLENRDDGVYAHGFFNSTSSAKTAKILVQSGDVNALSIYAGNLTQQGNNVLHGDIKEVSLVLSGANPGALIENVNLQHGDVFETLEDEAIIHTGLTLEHQEDTGEDVADSKTKDEKTVKDVFDEFTEEQKNVVYFMIGEALNDAEGGDDDDDDDDDDSDDAEHSSIKDGELDVKGVFATLNDDQKDVVHYLIGEALNRDTPDDNLKHSQEGTPMTRNVFEQNGATTAERPTLSHSQIQTIVEDAKKMGSFRDSFLAHAVEYGFENIDVLFPDAKAISNEPSLVSRRMEWVSDVINSTKHSPFSRVKTIHADITAEEARARGYVKGNMKKDEIVKLLKRKTDPTTIYKKQKLDRDDIIDITDLDVVAWLKGEMRIMLDEEIARAILIGDGRSAGHEDKIDEDRIRPIASDDEFYAHPVVLQTNASVDARIEALIRARAVYRGTGQPVFYTTLSFLTDMLLHKDKMGRRIYGSKEELASALMVSKIVDVEVMETEPDLVGIFVNLTDYTIGSNKGGNVSMFDDFDIDYNQFKYLMETRISGALTLPKSAIVVKRTPGTEVTPVSPSFDGATNTITIPDTTGVIYTIEGIPVEGSEVITSDTEVEAEPDSGYSFPAGSTTHWTFVYSGD